MQPVLIINDLRNNCTMLHPDCMPEFTLYFCGSMRYSRQSDWDRKKVLDVRSGVCILGDRSFLVHLTGSRFPALVAPDSSGAEKSLRWYFRAYATPAEGQAFFDSPTATCPSEIRWVAPLEEGERDADRRT